MNENLQKPVNYVKPYCRIERYALELVVRLVWEDVLELGVWNPYRLRYSHTSRQPWLTQGSPLIMDTKEGDVDVDAVGIP